VTTLVKSNRSRGIKNSLAKWLITLGGISVLFTLVLIFLYLLYVVKPIFESAEIEQSVNISLKVHTDEKVLSTGVDELKELAYQITDSGKIDFYHLKESLKEAQNKFFIGDKALTTTLLRNDDDEQVIKVVDSFSANKLLLTDSGNILLFQPSFFSDYQNNIREIIAKVNYPLGQGLFAIDNSQKALSELAFEMDDERIVFVAFTQDKRLIKTTFVAEDEFGSDSDGDEVEFERFHQQLDFSTSALSVDEIKVSPDLSLAFVRTGSKVLVYSIADEDELTLKATITPQFENENTYLSSMALLSGSSSVLLGDSRGNISQWFEVATDSGRQFEQIRSFSSAQPKQGASAIKEIYTEQFRKSFYTMTESGMVNVFYTTSSAHLWQGQLTSTQPNAFAIAPRANGLVVITDSSTNVSKVNEQTLQVFNVHNEHPEVTWQALWQEVWYEGYPEPDYVWQSTSGSDDFEGKFSLVPISFGTIKAALYAMMFAVPIALTAAIYTAYFMTPVLRKKVKPTIEMMEALPTVILGFLAGLWLAPLMEEYLPAIFLLFVFLPLSTVITAFAWHNLPNQLKDKLPETLAPVILIPVMILAIYAAFSLSGIVELTFFGGDMRQYLTNDLGIDFDQRNALVVGIAMGFAVIPTIFSMAEDAIFSVPSHLTSGSLALGATQWQTLVKVVLLTASPGIFSAVMMGLGRAVGETMIVLMATGNTPILDWSIFQGMRTLAANIAVEMPESEVGSSHYRILFLAAFVLFVFTFIFNTAAEFVRQRLREKYSSM